MPTLDYRLDTELELDLDVEEIIDLVDQLSDADQARIISRITTPVGDDCKEEMPRLALEAFLDHLVECTNAQVTKFIKDLLDEGSDKELIRSIFEYALDRFQRLERAEAVKQKEDNQQKEQANVA